MFGLDYMIAYIDKTTQELISVGFPDPEYIEEQVKKLGLENWGWISKNDRAIPDSWEVVELK